MTADSFEFNVEVNTLNFFDNIESKTRTPSPSPNDENLHEVDNEVTFVGREGSSSQSDRVVDHLEQIHQNVIPHQSVDLSTATPLDENLNSEGNAVPEIDVPSFQNSFQNESLNQTEEGTTSQRRSSRSSKLPARLNDYVLESKLKYGLNNIEESLSEIQKDVALLQKPEPFVQNDDIEEAENDEENLGEIQTDVSLLQKPEISADQSSRDESESNSEIEDIKKSSEGVNIAFEMENGVNTIWGCLNHQILFAHFLEVLWINNALNR
ncbi:Nucleic acid-binding, OB-fold [Artemisia annua]|uniref:Nucleic acid-binding, OB-fold n=1 Tax=Artemisia annua TaxID=35608 RepID=A0A2U1P2L8_ARTAN|nr:Nucleic acid-binding, OB-fold [Artemisia annua]